MASLVKSKPAARDWIRLAQLGLSVMTLATLVFYVFSNRLAVRRSLKSVEPVVQAISRSPYEGVAQHHGEEVILNTEELTRLLRKADIELQELRALVKDNADRLIELQSKELDCKKRKTDEEEDIAQILAPLISLLAWGIGIVILSEALCRVSEAQWFQTAGIGVVGANIGVVWALWRGDRFTWDRLILSGLVVTDLGMAIGVLFALISD